MVRDGFRFLAISEKPPLYASTTGYYRRNNRAGRRYPPARSTYLLTWPASPRRVSDPPAISSVSPATSLWYSACRTSSESWYVLGLTYQRVCHADTPTMPDCFAQSKGASALHRLAEPERRSKRTRHGALDGRPGRRPGAGGLRTHRRGHRYGRLVARGDGGRGCDAIAGAPAVLPHAAPWQETPPPAAGTRCNTGSVGCQRPVGVSCRAPGAHRRWSCAGNIAGTRLHILCRAGSYAGAPRPKQPRRAWLFTDDAQRNSCTAAREDEVYH